MRLEQAIITAMDIEAKIRDLYRQAHDDCKDPAGKRFFAMLRDDEQYHHDYLNDRLSEVTAGWRDDISSARYECADLR